MSLCYWHYPEVAAITAVFRTWGWSGHGKTPRAPISVRGATCDLCATCDFWTLLRDSCIKRYPSGVCPSPARETAPGFHCADGAPKKRPWFFRPQRPEPPNASVFWPPPPRTPNRKTGRGVRRMPQFRKGQTGNPAGRPSSGGTRRKRASATSGCGWNA